MNKYLLEASLIISKCLLKVSIPAFILFLIIWQSVEHAHLSRQVKKINIKKEALYKKNFELKAGIATFASAEKMENYYKQNSSFTLSAYNKKTVTILLPPEKKSFFNFK
jgi:hypothetical protein